MKSFKLRKEDKKAKNQIKALERKVDLLNKEMKDKDGELVRLRESLEEHQKLQGKNGKKI